MTRLLLTLLISFVPLANADYASCILENMKSVGSDVAAEEIASACKALFPSIQKQTKPDESIRPNPSQDIQITETVVQQAAQNKNNLIDNGEVSELSVAGDEGLCSLASKHEELFRQLQEGEANFLNSDKQFDSGWPKEEIKKSLDSLSASAPDRCVSYRVHLTNSIKVERFSYPDGQIYLSAGLVAQITNAEILTRILAHELAHISFLQIALTKNSDKEFKSRDESKRTISLGSAVAGLAVTLATGSSLAGSTVGELGKINSIPKQLLSEEDEKVVVSIEQDILSRSELSSSSVNAFIDPISGNFDHMALTDDSKRHFLVANTSATIVPDTSFMALQAGFVTQVARLAVEKNFPRYALKLTANYRDQGISSPEFFLIEGLAYQKLDDFPKEISASQRRRIQKDREVTPVIFTVDEYLMSSGISRWGMSNHSEAIESLSKYLEIAGAEEAFALFARAQSHLIVSNFDAGAKDLIAYLRINPDVPHRSKAIMQLRKIKEKLVND